MLSEFVLFFLSLSLIEYLIVNGQLLSPYKELLSNWYLKLQFRTDWVLCSLIHIFLDYLVQFYKRFLKLHFIFFPW